MPNLKSTQDYLAIAVAEVKSQASELTDFYEGSINDIILGAFLTAVEEAVAVTVSEFKKTFFDTASGPEVTGGVDDLENLAVDHFGSDFARPAAQKATGVVTFSRANTAAGNVTIAAGTVVKTPPDANGETQSFEVISGVTLTGTEISASVRAVVAGTPGNVEADTVTVIESTLTDPSVTVNNAAAMSGGAAEQTDALYRQTIKNQLLQLRGATKSSIEAKAKTVSGVEQATALESLQTVIEYDPSDGSTSGGHFQVARARLYIADANGTANAALVDLVEAAIESVRALGVRVDVIGATAVSLDWTASITLNPAGPNYGTLQTDASDIEQSMTQYVQELAIGADFDRAAARTAILAQWGPAGSNDLTDFVISVPSGDVATASNEKLTPGTISVS